jgi:hypothetical protein
MSASPLAAPAPRSVSSPWRLLAAWSWLRWRTLANTVAGRRRGGRRVAAWLGLLANVALAVIVGALGLALAGAAWLAGRSLPGAGTDGPAPTGIRIAAAAVTVVIVVCSLLAGGRRTGSLARLLLLPVSRAWLHALEVLAALGDPWMLVAAPALLALVMALGLGPAGPGAGLLAAVGGGLFYLLLATLDTLLAIVVQLLFRNRRRAEMVALVGFLAMMAVSVVPQVLMGRDLAAETKGRPARRQPSARLEASGPWLRAIPSEAYAGVLVAAAEREPARAALPLAVLAGETALLLALSAALWRRLLASPALGSRRRAGVSLPRLAKPGSLAGHPALAVARAQVATAMRTVAGRVATATPVLMVVVFSVAMRGGPFETFASLMGSTAVLSVGSLSILVFQAVLLNQFGADGAGLSLLVLSPLGDRALVAGKVLGGAALTAIGLVPALVAAALLQPAIPLLLWPATVLAAAAGYLLFAPAALWLSLLFPKAADLSQLGSKGKPHAAAALLGILSLGVSLLFVQTVAVLGRLVAGVPGMLVAEALLTVAAAAVALPLLASVAAALPGRRDAVLLAVREG